MIPFNIPTITGKEEEFIRQALGYNKLAGDGTFTKKCNTWFEKEMNIRKTLLTTSCTHALEMSAILAGIEVGDEVIMPSYTFVSTANAFVLRGAEIVFVDIRPDTMNINEKLIERAITKKTKAIVPVHYAGVSCEMNLIMDIAKWNNLLVIEDAAQGVMSRYNNQFLGTIGDIGCFSFHETKNYNCGEGGALLTNDERFIERAEIIREKGTNRSRFFRGQVDKYTWVDIGSSYLPSELNAAFLYAQLLEAEIIHEDRMKTWRIYFKGLQELHEKGLLELPFVPDNCSHNAHMFYIKLGDLSERTEFIQFMKENDIGAVFHYIPLHSSPAGKTFGRFDGDDLFTTIESERLVRLPLFYNMDSNQVYKVIDCIYKFFKKKKEI